jgi:hypothetical protein
MVLISGLQRLLGWERLPLYGRYDFVEMIKFLMTRILLLQVIYRCTDILRLWSPLQRVKNHNLFTEICTRLEATERDIFFLHGWQHNRGENRMDYFRPTDRLKAYGWQKWIRSDSCWIWSRIRLVFNGYGKWYGFTNIRPYLKIYHISRLYSDNIRQNIRQ